MTIQIPDELLRAAKLDERQLMIELACFLFDKDQLTISEARRLAGMGRGESEDLLGDRGIPIYRPTLEDFERDMRNLAELDNRERKGADAGSH